ncbi:MAG: S1/P1 Nuclease [Flavobacteriales bacterium]|jgi:hypothetical protein|nr:S1/P1 Nuclease [Flavobacteriales bacterium]MBT4703959.1 S1/P1 Nuclease [Flavobacteriales bacterium]MBT4930345.1 S1/P1 Nuclease [Flavobacteriales bacterium]MBT5132568.1 S1/P1 Nuclease [Flavobacteriales bacterium]MBT6133235.1 S1/P1 Nuclease [Flavobacteriales bacterium]
MKRLLLISLVLVFPLISGSWGFFGHKKINRIAVFTLPSELMAFYKENIEFITNHAVDPDMRRYVLPAEAPRHYIDIDHYGESPFDEVPRRWDSAVTKYTEDTLQAYGVVPWHINLMYRILVKKFESRDLSGILKTSADIGHYIADAHVPLHTTENYNGQLTDQKGIHGFWESRLPELYTDDFDLFTGRAFYIESPLDYVWDEVEKSHHAVDSVLGFEKALSSDYPSDRKYSFEDKGRSTVQTYSRDYSAEYYLSMDGMVERRMRRAIISVGSLWYSAWVEAGKPDLSSTNPLDLEQFEQEQDELEAKKGQQKILGRIHGD